MPNFSHTKNLSDYSYEVIKNLREIAAIFDSEQISAYELWRLIEQIMDAQFIMTADATGIQVYEKFLKISPNPNETLDERRANVLAAFQNALPYTRKMLKNLILALGIPEKSLRITYPDNFHVVVEVAKTYENLMNFLAAMLEQMSPYTMENSVKLMTFMWGDAKLQNWGYEPLRTWEEFLYGDY
jgi:hypothetical protein